MNKCLPSFWIMLKVRFLYQCSDHSSHSKNFTSLFPLIFLSKHISLYALGRLKWILDIIWPLNQHFKLKNQRNWLEQVWMWKFWNVINCILLHWRKKLTLYEIFLHLVSVWVHFEIDYFHSKIIFKILRSNTSQLGK